jgi:hypothetical protein
MMSYAIFIGVLECLAALIASGALVAWLMASY